MVLMKIQKSMNSHKLKEFKLLLTLCAINNHDTPLPETDT